MRKLVIALAFAGLVSGVGAAPSPAYIYWANFNQGGGTTIGRALNDGTSVNQSFIGGASAPVDPVVDGDHIYWGNYGDPGSIGRANLDGTGVDQNFISGVRGPDGIAVDAHHIYWANYFGDTIGRANLDGTGVDQSFIHTPNIHAYGVAVDGSHVYWSNFYSIGRANLDGTAADPAFITTNYVQELALDGGHLYWGEYIDGSIGRANLDGTGVNPGFITGATTPRGVTTFAGHIYWANYNSYTVGRASLDGSSADESFIGALQPWGVAVDALPLGPPSAHITQPLDNRAFGLDQHVATSFACTDVPGGPGIASCVDSNGVTAPAGVLNTANAGAFSYSVRAISRDGQSDVATIHYAVAKAPTALDASAVVPGGVSARLIRSDTRAALAGQTLVFTAGSKKLCTAVTDSLGRAGCRGLAARLQAIGNRGYSVTYAGGRNFLPATGRGQLIALPL